MSENTSGDGFTDNPGTPSDDSGSNADDSGTNSGGDSGTKAVSWDEHEKVKNANDWAQGMVKRQKTQIAELSERLTQLEKPKGKENSKTLDNALAEIETLRGQLSERDGKIHELRVKQSVQMEADKHLVEGSFSDFWASEGESFVFDDEKGEVVPKDKPYQSLPQFFAEFGERKPYFMRSTRLKGTDDGKRATDSANPRNSSDQGLGPNATKSEVRKYLSTLSPEAKAEWKKKNLSNGF